MGCKFDITDISQAESNTLYFTSRHHELDGQFRKKRSGIFDWSLIALENNETANVREMRKVNENQK